MRKNKISQIFTSQHQDEWLTEIQKYACECNSMEEQYDLAIGENMVHETTKFHLAIKQAAQNVLNNDFVWWLHNALECESFRKAKRKVFQNDTFESIKLADFPYFFMLEFALARVIRHFVSNSKIESGAVLTQEETHQITQVALKLRSIINGKLIFESNVENYLFKYLLNKLSIKKHSNIIVKQADRGNSLRRILTVKIIEEIIHSPKLKHATSAIIADIVILMTELFFDEKDRRKEVRSLVEQIRIFSDKENALKQQTIYSYLNQLPPQINVGELEY
jgi:hypothetical protein